MSRLVASILCIFALLFMTAGPIEHAAELPGCTEVTSTAHPGDASGNPSDPGRSDQDVHHQHGCHGHHFAALPRHGVLHDLESRADALSALPASQLHGGTVDPGLKPPKA